MASKSACWIFFDAFSSREPGIVGRRRLWPAKAGIDFAQKRYGTTEVALTSAAARAIEGATALRRQFFAIAFKASTGLAIAVALSGTKFRNVGGACGRDGACLSGCRRRCCQKRDCQSAEHQLVHLLSPRMTKKHFTLQHRP
jgi:hypothetical protein